MNNLYKIAVAQEKNTKSVYLKSTERHKLNIGAFMAQLGNRHISNKNMNSP